MTNTDTFVAFHIGQWIVTEYAARDNMHPSRTVNNTYVTDPQGREHWAGSNGFAHGVTLTYSTAESKVQHFMKRLVKQGNYAK